MFRHPDVYYIYRIHHTRESFFFSIQSNTSCKEIYLSRELFLVVMAMHAFISDTIR